MPKAEALGVEDVNEVLKEIYALEGDDSKGQFRMLCPVHESKEGGHTPSCDVDLVTGYWNCFSCPASGDLVDLGVVVLEELEFIPFDSRKDKQKREWGKARKKIEKILAPDDPDAVAAAVRRRLRAARTAVKPPKAPKDRFKPVVPPVDSYEFKMIPFLKNRGFTKATLKRWKIRYVRSEILTKDEKDDHGRYKTFEITHAVGIPIFDEKSKLVGWCYRATEKSEAWFQNVRYIYTPGITDTLSQMWFGLNLQLDANEVAVCEGALDAIWCDQNGIPAVAILGSQVKQAVKIRKLQRFRNIVLFTDRDLAGVTTAMHLGMALRDRGVPCTVARYPRWMLNRRGEPAKDPQDLSGLDIELVFHRATPFTIWRREVTAA